MPGHYHGHVPEGVSLSIHKIWDATVKIERFRGFASENTGIYYSFRSFKNDDPIIFVP